MAKKTRTKRPQKMKSYASFDLWLEDQSKSNQAIIKSLRSLVASTSKKLEETVKWGNGCWTLDNLPICYAYADKDHMQFGFFIGSQLKDPKELLEGNGKYVRFKRLYDKADIPKAALTTLLKQAMKIKYR